MSNEVRCPKCNSNQLSANKKGFSGKKAFAGVLLTGGIGALAGTIGSNDIVITCLNCGKEFAPGEGAKPQPKAKEIEGVSGHDKEALKLFQEKGRLAAISYYKTIKDIPLDEAKQYIDELAVQHGLQQAIPKGCAGLILLLVTLSLATAVSLFA